MVPAGGTSFFALRKKSVPAERKVAMPTIALTTTRKHTEAVIDDGGGGTPSYVDDFFVRKRR